MEKIFNSLSSYKYNERMLNIGKLEELFILDFDKLQSEILNVFLEKLNDENFQTKILNTFLKRKKIELESYLKDSKLKDSKEEQEFQKMRIIDLKNQVNIKTYQELFQHFEKSMDRNQFIKAQFLQENPNKLAEVEKYYPVLYCLKVLYDEHTMIQNRINILNNFSKNIVEELYKNIGVNLTSHDKNFKKYGLKTLDNNVLIFCDKDNQCLIDNHVNKKYCILFNRRLLLECLESMYQEKIITELSFRIDNVSEKSFLLLEERDFGAKLNSNLRDLPEISKFYNIENMDNNFWVFHDKDKKQISFEELCDDFELMNDDVVTQLVHLEYQNNGDDYIIKHIDHEYIIYTVDEYEKRLSDNSQKGYKKVKTFKVDNSNIPFFYKYKGQYFLFIVLNSFFKHEDLLKEYFEDIDD